MMLGVHPNWSTCSRCEATQIWRWVGRPRPVEADMHVANRAHLVEFVCLLLHSNLLWYDNGLSVYPSSYEEVKTFQSCQIDINTFRARLFCFKNFYILFYRNCCLKRDTNQRTEMQDFNWMQPKTRLVYVPKYCFPNIVLSTSVAVSTKTVILHPNTFIFSSLLVHLTWFQWLLRRAVCVGRPKYNVGSIVHAADTHIANRAVHLEHGCASRQGLSS